MLQLVTDGEEKVIIGRYSIDYSCDDGSVGAHFYFFSLSFLQVMEPGTCSGCLSVIVALDCGGDENALRWKGNL